jgi:hybrid cluster-associated redox disulfide protein
MATINKEMSIGQVLGMDRSTASIFMQHGMHCLGCPHATAESLSDACAAHGADADALVEKLNAHLAAKA